MNLSEYITTVLPSLETSTTFTTTQRQQFEQGLDLIKDMPNAQQFIRESRMFRDYPRRTTYLRKYLEQLSQNTHRASASPLWGRAGGESSPRHVGRPTKAEQAAYREAETEKAKKEAEFGLFPEVKPDTSVQPLTYNGIVANPDGESIAATMPHLQDIKWFLSQSLQERVNTVRDLRNERAALAEQAKQMALANEKATTVPGASASGLYSEEEVSAVATRACEIESDILPAIFCDVDREMGEVYLRLSEKSGDPEYIKFVEKHISTPIADLRTKFKCFFEKATERDPRFPDTIAEKIANDRPEVKAQRDAEAKKKAEANAIIKYLQRKDKPNTAKRIKGMEKKLEELSALIGNEEAAPYYRLLDAAKEDYEKNIKPKK